MTFTYSIGPDVRIRFAGKPDERIRSMLKANGFRWSPASGQWWRNRVRGAADFLAALDKAMNPRRPDGACWRCNAPDGYFRPYGAATPVYCDRCYAEQRQAEAERNGVTAADGAAHTCASMYDVSCEACAELRNTPITEAERNGGGIGAPDA